MRLCVGSASLDEGLRTYEVPHANYSPVPSVKVTSLIREIWFLCGPCGLHVELCSFSSADKNLQAGFLACDLPPTILLAEAWAI